MRFRPKWMVINQSQNESFQRLLANLSIDIGPCLLLTGNPFPSKHESLRVMRAPAYRRSGKMGRVTSWACFLAVATWRALRVTGRPLVFVTTNPPFLIHLAWVLHRLFGQRYVLLIWDLYPDHIVQTGLARNGNPVIWAWRALNRQAFRAAEVVIALGDTMAEAIRAQMRGSSIEIEIIPGWADVEEIKPIPKSENPFARAHRQVGKLTVMYSGNLGATHGVEVIAELAYAFREDPRVHFIVIGSGLGRGSIEAKASVLTLTNLTFLDFQSNDMFPFSQAAADVALVMQAPGTENLSVPSKTYTSLAAGSALLAFTSLESDLARLVEECKAGAIVPMNEPERAADVIRGWLADPAQLAKVRAAARRAAEERFSAAAARARFAAVLGPAMAG